MKPPLHQERNNDVDQAPPLTTHITRGPGVIIHAVVFAAAYAGFVKETIALVTCRVLKGTRGVRRAFPAALVELLGDPISLICIRIRA